MRFTVVGAMGVVWLALCLAACAGSPPAPAPSVDVTSTPVAVRLDAVSAVVAERRAALGLPGVSVALVDGDELVWAGGHGVAVVESSAPASSQTVYRVGSVSKPIAATVVTRLAAQGRLDLDAPIGEHVEGLPAHIASLTARQILGHTTGIRHYRYEDGEKENARVFGSVDEAIRIYGVLDEPLAFEPGGGYLYSTYAYNLLAALVPGAVGQSFAEVARVEVFEPADMRTAQMATPGGTTPDRSGQYRLEEGAFVPAPEVDLSWKLPGGGVLASVEDMARFAIALDTGALLAPDDADRLGVYRAVTLPDGSSTGYGLGWHVKDDARGRWVGHGGGATGGAAYLLRRPERGFAVAVATNLEIRSAELAALARAVEDAWRGDAVSVAAEPGDAEAPAGVAR